MTEYAFFTFLHVVLFAYWLGADLGVHLAARFAVRAELPFDERMRFLVLILMVDLGPETALTLIVPVGLSMCAAVGLSTLDGWPLLCIWMFGLLWLAAIWRMHAYDIFQPGVDPPLKHHLHRLDRWARYIAILGTAAMGISSWLGYGPLLTTWLAAKTLVYAVALVRVALFRHELSAWGVAIEQLQKPATVAQGNALIMKTHKTGRWYAWSLWALVAFAAWLGIAKPALA